MHYILLVISFVCLGTSTSFLSADTNTSPQDAGKIVSPAPSLKSPKSTEAPPATVRTRYDRARNATYVQVDIPLSSPRENKPAGGVAGAAGGTTISFQLAYRGKSTSGLSAAYLIINSTIGTDQVREFDSEKQVSLAADGYLYKYDRIDYPDEQVEPTASQSDTRRIIQESIIVKLHLDDLSQIANSNKLEIRVGKVEFVVKSLQLIELRRALISK